MKFTIITHYYHPTPDGIAHYTAYLNQYLTKPGHSVQIIYDYTIISLQPIYKKHQPLYLSDTLINFQKTYIKKEESLKLKIYNYLQNDI